MKFNLILFILLFSFGSNAQNKIKWMTWEEATAAHNVEPRKILVDVYTDWCKVCKKMDKATLQKDLIAKYINENYYPIKFNAEYKKDIVFQGKNYKYIGSGSKGFHELAVVITQGKLKFPTYVFLDESFKILQPIPGYQDTKTFELIVSYFANDYNKTIPWRTYVRQYSPDILTQPVKN